MLETQVPKPEQATRFTIRRRQTPGASGLLVSLLQDTSAPVLVFLSERYGLRRVPGLTKQALIERILKHLDAEALESLKNDLIAARYGSLPIQSLVRHALALDRADRGRPSPRLDQVSAAEARLVESGGQRWVYTLRGHDVIIDLARRTLGCDCRYFAFAARRRALCKHLAAAMELIPEVYAREALIDLLVAREFGGQEMPKWIFRSQAA